MTVADKIGWPRRREEDYIPRYGVVIKQTRPKRPPARPSVKLGHLSQARITGLFASLSLSES